MRINQNIAAFNAYNNLSRTQNRLSGSLEKLSSGFRINRAADDAAGLTNSESLRSQIGGLKVATRNAQDAISLVQTAEGAQTEVHSILQRMRDLAVQSGNLGTNDNNALKANQSEMDELVKELNRIADETQFGTQQILNGDFDATTDVAGTLTTDGASVTATPAGAADPSTMTFDLEAVAKTAVGPATGNESMVDRDITYTIAYDGGAAVEVTFNYGADAGEAAENLETALGNLNAAEKAALNGPTVTRDGVNNTVSISTSTDTTAAGEVYAVAANSTTISDGIGEGAVFQVGANRDQTVKVNIKAVSAADLLVQGLSIGEGATETTIGDAIDAIDSAISTVSENRSELGAMQNRMESTIRNLSVAVENLSAAESRIRDTDMALEMVEFTRNQILSQAGTAMLAQANQVPQSVLSLLQ